MAYYLPDEPVVVVQLVKNEQNVVQSFKIATNVSPNTKVLLCEDAEDFERLSEGKPFKGDGSVCKV